MTYQTAKKRGTARRWLLYAAAGALIVAITVWSITTTPVRWLFHSKRYKAQVQAQPAEQNGSLKHIEWEGWGFAGAGDTVVYLVFDPNDYLAEPARDRSHGSFGGVPCEVYRVDRLESHWYTVFFYTDTDWDHCQ